ncbi:hypothetical protein GOV04_03070 [Candidatus Woesearchaeota archaeon]|nr:hypothetical protein [Candidatus Woesearchaeota archaeon]
MMDTEIEIIRGPVEEFYCEQALQALRDADLIDDEEEAFMIGYLKS